MPRIEFNDFYNDGFGFVCNHCEREADKNYCQNQSRARYMHEGEAENKQPKFSNSALAKWLDKAQTTLICPRCGITEKVE